MSGYEHEFGAPVAVPFVCRRCSPAKTELLFFKQILSPSIIQSVDGFFSHVFLGCYKRL